MFADSRRQTKLEKMAKDIANYCSFLMMRMVLSPKIPSVASKSGHETKKRVLKESQTCRVLPPIIKSSTAVKTNCPTKGKRIV